MSKRLLEAGHELAVYNRTASRMEPLVQLGAKGCASPMEAARDRDIVISIVGDGPDVEEVLVSSSNAAIKGAAAGTLFVDMSTIAPATAQRVGEQLRQAGMRFLDAPVTGGDVGAREGTLSILVGGAETDLEDARPIFEVLGKRITLCGAQGAGQVVKACNQIMGAMNLLGVAEALHLGQKNGVAAETIVAACSAGASGSWSLERLGARISRGDFEPGFMVRLLQKDLRIVSELAAESGAHLAGTPLARDLFSKCEANGESEKGTQVVWRVFDRASRG